MNKTEMSGQNDGYIPRSIFLDIIRFKTRIFRSETDVFSGHSFYLFIYLFKQDMAIFLSYYCLELFPLLK